jgi:hypothetical protein
MADVAIVPELQLSGFSGFSRRVGEKKMQLRSRNKRRSHHQKTM